MMRKSKFIIMAALLAVMCTAGGCGNKAVSADGTSAQEESLENTSASADETETSSLEEAFPILIDNDRLSVDSVFTFDGTNPDKNFEEQDSICSMQLTNVSDAYLDNATITLVCGHGEEYHFTIEDIPAGMTVYAFDTDNHTCEQKETVKKVTIDSDFDENGTELLNSEITATYEGSTVTLKNSGSESYENLIIKYHDNMDGVLFGGASGEMSLDSLNSGSDAEFTVDDATFGEVTVTSVKEK